jgi:pimeloyl-ACP methyl ester carboxylesterase
MQVLIIGISLTMHDWTPRLLKVLAAQREVVIFDTPGIGLSSIAEGSAPAAADYFRFQAQAIAGFVTALDLQQPDLLGW